MDKPNRSAAQAHIDALRFINNNHINNADNDKLGGDLIAAPEGDMMELLIRFIKDEKLLSGIELNEVKTIRSGLSRSHWQAYLKSAREEAHRREQLLLYRNPYPTSTVPTHLNRMTRGDQKVFRIGDPPTSRALNRLLQANNNRPTMRGIHVTNDNDIGNDGDSEGYNNDNTTTSNGGVNRGNNLLSNLLQKLEGIDFDNSKDDDNDDDVVEEDRDDDHHSDVDGESRNDDDEDNDNEEERTRQQYHTTDDDVSRDEETDESLCDDDTDSAHRFIETNSADAGQEREEISDSEPGNNEDEETANSTENEEFESPFDQGNIVTDYHGHVVAPATVVRIEDQILEDHDLDQQSTEDGDSNIDEADLQHLLNLLKARQKKKLQRAEEPRQHQQQPHLRNPPKEASPVINPVHTTPGLSRAIVPSPPASPSHQKGISSYQSINSSHRLLSTPAIDNVQAFPSLPIPQPVQISHPNNSAAHVPRIPAPTLLAEPMDIKSREDIIRVDTSVVSRQADFSEGIVVSKPVALEVSAPKEIIHLNSLIRPSTYHVLTTKGPINRYQQGSPKPIRRPSLHSSGGTSAGTSSEVSATILPQSSLGYPRTGLGLSTISSSSSSSSSSSLSLPEPATRELHPSIFIPVEIPQSQSNNSSNVGTSVPTGLEIPTVEIKLELARDQAIRTDNLTVSSRDVQSGNREFPQQLGNFDSFPNTSASFRAGDLETSLPAESFPQYHLRNFEPEIPVRDHRIDVVTSLDHDNIPGLTASAAKMKSIDGVLYPASQGSVCASSESILMPSLTYRPRRSSSPPRYQIGKPPKGMQTIEVERPEPTEEFGFDEVGRSFDIFQLPAGHEITRQQFNETPRVTHSLPEFPYQSRYERQPKTSQINQRQREDSSSLGLDRSEASFDDEGSLFRQALSAHSRPISRNLPTSAFGARSHANMASTYSEANQRGLNSLADPSPAILFNPATSNGYVNNVGARSKPTGLFSSTSRICIAGGALQKAHDEFPVRIDVKSSCIDVVWREAKSAPVNESSRGKKDSRPNIPQSVTTLRRERFRFDEILAGHDAPRTLKKLIHAQVRSALMRNSLAIDLPGSIMTRPTRVSRKGILTYILTGCNPEYRTGCDDELASFSNSMEHTLGCMLGQAGLTENGNIGLIEESLNSLFHTIHSAQTQAHAGNTYYRDGRLHTIASPRARYERLLPEVSMSVLHLWDNQVVDLMRGADPSDTLTDDPNENFVPELSIDGSDAHPSGSQGVNLRRRSDGSLCVSGATKVRIASIDDYHRVIGVILGRRKAVRDLLQSVSEANRIVTLQHAFPCTSKQSNSRKVLSASAVRGSSVAVPRDVHHLLPESRWAAYGGKLDGIPTQEATKPSSDCLMVVINVSGRCVLPISSISPINHLSHDESDSENSHQDYTNDSYAPADTRASYLSTPLNFTLNFVCPTGPHWNHSGVQLDSLTEILKTGFTQRPDDFLTQYLADSNNAHSTDIVFMFNFFRQIFSTGGNSNRPGSQQNSLINGALSSLKVVGSAP